MVKSFLAFCVMFWSLAVQATEPVEVRILRQPGQTSNMILLYPTVDRFERLAQQAGIPVRVSLQPLGNVSDGIISMLAGKTDVIMGAIIPFAFANDRAPDRLKLLTGSSSQNHDIICSNPEIKTVSDIKPHHKIAMKNLGSTEQFFLRQLSKKFFGDYFAMDQNIVTMPRPLIASLMISLDRSIDCAVPGTPLQGSLVASGHARKIFSSDQKEIIGNVHGTFASKAWLDRHPRLAEIWIQAVDQTARSLDRNIDPAISMFISNDLARDSADSIKQSLMQSNQKHSVQPIGIVEQLQFLHATGLLKNPVNSLDSLLWRPMPSTR